MFLKILLFLYFGSTFGVILDLNETEYDRMPPLFALDEYPRCLRINSTYCLVTLYIQPDTTNEVSTIIQDYSKYRTRHYNHSIIDRGVCVTRSCGKFISSNQLLETKEDLEEVLEGCLNDSIFHEYGVETTINNVLYCDRHDDKKEINIYQRLVAAIFVGLLLMNVIGSLYDVCLQKSIGQKNCYAGNAYILGFSIRRNWRDFVAPIKESSRLYQLRSLHGVRVISMALAILAHTVMTVCSYIDNPHDIEKWYDSLLFRMEVTGSSLVHIFFMMSAFLLGYKLLEDEQQGKDTVRELPKTLFLRWWRLTPVYAVCLAFIATWLERSGSGPLWSLLRETVVKDCQRYWWLHLLYLNNYVPEDAHCMLQTWHVASDMQLYIVGLLSMVVLRRWRLQTVLAMLVLGVAAPAVTVWKHDLDARIIFNPENFRHLRDSSGTFDLVYKPGHNNVLLFACGLIASMLCHHYQRTGLKINKYKILTPFYAVLVPGLIALFLTGIRYYSPAQAPLLERALYTPLMHLVLGAMLIVAIVGMVLGYDAGLCSFLCWRAWPVLARLSYCMYLVHFPLLHLLAASRTQLDHASFINIMINFFGVYAISMLLALLLYLLVESPCHNLMTTYFNGEVRRRGKKQGDKKQIQEKRGDQKDEEKGSKEILKLGEGDKKYGNGNPRYIDWDQLTSFDLLTTLYLCRGQVEGGKKIM